MALVYCGVFPDWSYYIGTTTTTLKERLRNHRNDCKRKPHLPLYKKIEEVGWENVEWFVIEETEDRRNREQYWIEQNPEWCLNLIRANRTAESIKNSQAKADKNFYKEHRQERINSTIEWRKQNRDKWNAYQREYYLRKKNAPL